MSRYHPSAPYPPDPAAYDRQSTRLEPARHDATSSHSHAFHDYLHIVKDEADIPEAEAEEDPHLALTSQTLNADGTPKRPMNAFMIYARRRRPQISAANQMMRTGDISKILSKEWSTMDMSEKKFYLDQAKKLKENFNSKYPDYVYRRRPNNSRKKRKAESDLNASPGLSPGADGEDGSLEDGSPIDDDPIMGPIPQGYQYSPPGSAASSAAYDPHDDYAHPSSPYAQSSPEVSPGQFGQPARAHPAGLPSPAESAYASGGMAAGSSSGMRISSLPPPSALSQSYASPPQMHPSHSSGYPSSHTHGAWDPPPPPLRDPGRSEQGRPGWPVLPALDMSMARPRQPPSMAGSAPSERTELYSPQLSHRSWSSTASSTPSSGSGSGSASGVAPTYAAGYPTLTPAYFPSQPHHPSQSQSHPQSQSHSQSQSQSQSPSHRTPSSADAYAHAHAHASAPDYLHSPAPAGGGMHRALQLPYPGRAPPESAGGYAHSTTLAAPTSSAYLQSASAGAGAGGQWPSQYRVLPPPGAPQPQPQPQRVSPPQSASPHSAAGQQSSSHMGYWERSRYDAR